MNVVPNNHENHQAHVKYTSVIILKAASQAKLPVTHFLNTNMNHAFFPLSYVIILGISHSISYLKHPTYSTTNYD